MRVAYRIVIAAALVAALASCTKGPGAAAPANDATAEPGPSVPALIGTWQVTSYIAEEADRAKDGKITLTITEDKYTERYDPPFEFEGEEEAEIAMEVFSASYVADAETKVLTLSNFKLGLVGEDSELYETIANLLLADHPETLEFSYSFPETGQLRLEGSNGTIIATKK